MGNKLTLSIEKEIIQGAKEYAQSQGRSLSNIISEYLKSLSQSKTKEVIFEEDAVLESLFGSVKNPKNSSYKELLKDALTDKYL